MKFKIPFMISDMNIVERKSKYFVRFTRSRASKLDQHLKNASQEISRRNYIAICYRNFLINLFVFTTIITSILGLTGFRNFYLYGLGISFAMSALVLFNQYNYPRIFSLNKTRDIEKNLIPIMQDMLVQLNSGVPLFTIMANVSGSGYGEASVEFKKITSEINSGMPQIQALEKYGKINTSRYFKRVLWQISNGMRAGSDMGIVIREEIKNLGEEQEIQIQTYGNRLNPLVMFYMIIAVILPTLGITFLIIISSMLEISGTMVKILFGAIFVFIVFTQIMFLGVIKFRRPSLL